jgi:type II secretory pathway pseudopilin PulG
MHTALPSRIHRSAAFTLTELALCIAVIGIALVAIVGVLPSGMNVQKQNREETLMAQDAQFFMEAIRGGSLAIADLTNHLDYIRWRRTGAETFDRYLVGPDFTESLPGPTQQIEAAWQVIALLSLPRFETIAVGDELRIVENHITAQFRSLSSPFTEKSYRDGPGGRPTQARLATAFRYRIDVESQASVTRPPLVLQMYTNPVVSNIVANQQIALESSLNDLRLTFQWPVFRVGNDLRVGANRRSFRTQIYGTRQVVTTNLLGSRRLGYRFNGSPGVTNLVRF